MQTVLPSHLGSLKFPGNSLLSRSSNSLSALEKIDKMEKGALSSDDEDPDIPNFKTYLAHKLIQAKMYKNVSKHSPFLALKFKYLKI